MFGKAQEFQSLLCCLVLQVMQKYGKTDDTIERSTYLPRSHSPDHHRQCTLPLRGGVAKRWYFKNTPSLVVCGYGPQKAHSRSAASNRVL